VKRSGITLEAPILLTGGVILRWRPRMRRKLEVRISFAPMRLSATHLRAAYEQVLPVKKASVSEHNASKQAQVDSAPEEHSKKGQAS
jgi:hypothetical protein